MNSFRGADRRSFWEVKAEYFALHESLEERKNWYYGTYQRYHFKMIPWKFMQWLVNVKLPMYLSFLRWCLVDYLRGKQTRFKGIYVFVGMPGEGKTISMCAHIERMKKAYPNLVVATNFNLKGQNVAVEHWTDIIDVSLDAHKRKLPCLVAIDEIQNTFDATDFRNFPVALYTLLTFNRKLQLQFLCSAQMYERVPSKIRALANYTIICKNVWKRDRLFINYYFVKDNYESQFDGKRAKAEFVKQFIADDALYASYNTFEQVKTIKGRAEDEKGLREQAFDLLFGTGEDSDAQG